MARPLSRRTLLRTSALAATATAVSAAATGRATAAPGAPGTATAATGAAAAFTTVVPSAWTVRPFGLEDVTLGPGVFADKRQLMHDHVRGYDVRRLLQVFRVNAGLSAGGAVAPGGWEGLDGEANGNLRGHYTGHFLTMLAQAYRSTGERVFADRIGTMIGALTEVREALRHDPTLQTLFLGPVNLVVRDPSTGHLRCALYGNAGLSGDLLPSFTPVAGKPLHHTLNGVEFAPFAEGTETRRTPTSGARSRV
ncbi:hypothetical protein GCM10027073_45330 [Streptomyces chlorus]